MAIKLEVQSQVAPLKDLVTAHRADFEKLCNFNGGQPGYLQVARAADDKRYSELLDMQKEQIATSKEQTTAQAAINETVLDFVKTHNTRDKEEQDRKKQHEERLKFWVPYVWKAAAGFVAIVLTVAGFTYREVSPIVHILWMDYLKYHPEVTMQLKNTSTVQPQPALSSKTPPPEVSTVPRD